MYQVALLLRSGNCCRRAAAGARAALQSYSRGEAMERCRTRRLTAEERASCRACRGGVLVG